MPRTRQTKSTAGSSSSALQFIKFLCFLGLLLSMAGYASANDNEQAERDRIEQEARERLGDSLEPCSKYIEMRGACVFTQMGAVLEGVPTDVCEQVSLLLAQVPEDDQTYCEGLFAKASQTSEVDVNARRTASVAGKTVVDVETRKTETKPVGFPFQLADPDDKSNCRAYLESKRMCNDVSDGKACENAARFFKQLSKSAQNACAVMEAVADETVDENKREFAEQLSNFEL